MTASDDRRINTDQGGSMVHWNEPDGHQWAMATVSYAPPGPALTRVAAAGATCPALRRRPTAAPSRATAASNEPCGAASRDVRAELIAALQSAAVGEELHPALRCAGACPHHRR
jgi:hypothetical protein